MQTQDITKMLGIPRERIKKYKKLGVFTPEKAGQSGMRVEYTERDVQNLKRLEVLTKAGLTCTSIRKVQTGALTLAEAFNERMKKLQDDIVRKKGALALSIELIVDGMEYGSAGQYWEDIHQRELAGERFEEPEGEYQTISLDRVVQCPSCGRYVDIDFEEFVIDSTINPSDRDDDMGEDIVHTFDTEDNMKCNLCDCKFRVQGWVREYPVGAYDSESIEITVEGSEDSAYD